MKIQDIKDKIKVGGTLYQKTIEVVPVDKIENTGFQSGHFFYTWNDKTEFTKYEEPPLKIVKVRLPDGKIVEGEIIN